MTKERPYPMPRNRPQTLREISRFQAREVDRRAWESYGIPSLCLMENAGAGAAGVALEMLGETGASVLCACGPGQNGGDGLVVARHLAIAGCDVEILLLPGSQGERSPPAESARDVDRTARAAAAPRAAPAGDAGVNLSICEALGLTIREFRSSGPACERTPDLVVDALFGTGLTRPLAGPAAELVLRIAELRRPVLALDLPSGLDCDTGAPLGPCVRADVTATFVAPKLGFSRPGAAAWTGTVRVVGIGAPLVWPPAVR